MAEWKKDVIHQSQVIAGDLRDDLIDTHKRIKLRITRTDYSGWSVIP